ncbi:MAG: hypothetical protein KH020_00595 [Clostridiales bacterium]|nr:hypothetical protein [Clostridiales bacterium]
MKIQVIYSSLSGRTKRLAEAIADGMSKEDNCTIHNLKDGEPVLDGDIILLGYWVDKGGPEQKMKDFMEKVEGKAVGIFCTLGFYADSAHAHDSIINGVNVVKEKNTVIGSYVCNGALSEQIIAMFRQRGGNGTHSASPENEIRWNVMKNHPTDAECELAKERFRERVEIYKEFTKKGLLLKSILPMKEIQ